MKKLLVFLVFLSVQAWGQSSVLATGEWIRVEISNDGVYKIDKAFLDKHASAFSSANPSQIRVFTGTLGVLPQLNSTSRITDLHEVPVYVNDNNHQWDSGDYLLFYGFGSHAVSAKDGEFVHQINPYSNVNYYYITISNSNSLKINTKEFTPGLPLKTALPYYVFEEKETKNLLNSGRLWLGDFFNSTYTFSPPATDFVSDFSLKIEVLPLGRSKQFISISDGSTELIKQTLEGAPHNANDNLGRYHRISNFYPISYASTQPLQNIKMSLSSESVGNVGVYLNYWSLNYKRKLNFSSGQQVIYRTLPESFPYNGSITNATPNTKIWQVISPFSVKQLSLSTSGEFSPENLESEVVIFDEQKAENPKFSQIVANQNLRNSIVPEALVVFPEAFRKEAERLIAYKRENEDFEIAGYSAEEIYNEFSSGKVDPTAIRDFCKHLYRQAPEKFKFLLLLGDASFDFKNNNKATYVNVNHLVPSYQSRESLEPIYSYASDDYFGFLDDYEGVWPEGKSVNNQWISDYTDDHLMNISVGRIPVKSLLELNQYINKYITYKNNMPTASWQNKMAFVADNRDYNIHQRDAEYLEKIALDSYPGLVTEKLYLDDFPMINTNGAYSSPEANERFHELVNNGTYFITYIGHGAEDGFTNERLLTLSDILSFRNATKLPIWFTATCQFGKFDNPGLVSGAELSLLRPNGGAIALLTTTRAVYSSTNQLINQALFRNLNGHKTLGELFTETKNRSISGEINRNFSLLGDPTITLPNWENETTFTLSKDTLFATEKVAFSGSSPSVSEGELMVTIADKPSSKKTLGSFEDGPAFDYTLNSETIFIGTYPIANHRFSGEIKLPTQQTPGKGKGRVILTLTDKTNKRVEYGIKKPINISSEVKSTEEDKTPPDVTVHLDDSHNLVWTIADPSGINLSPFDKASKLTLIIDGDTLKNSIIYYMAVEGSIKGLVNYYVGNLANGSHFGTLIVSDIYNNVSIKTFDFETNREQLKILEASTYPNPVTDYFNIQIKHNKPGDDLMLKVTLIDITGRELWSEEAECMKCDEQFTYSTEFGKASWGFPKVYYKATLQSKSEKDVEVLSGSLFFWK